MRSCSVSLKLVALFGLQPPHSRRRPLQRQAQRALPSPTREPTTRGRPNTARGRRAPGTRRERRARPARLQIRAPARAHLCMQLGNLRRAPQGRPRRTSVRPGAFPTRSIRGRGHRRRERRSTLKKSPWGQASNSAIEPPSERHLPSEPGLRPATDDDRTPSTPPLPTVRFREPAGRE